MIKNIDFNVDNIRPFRKKHSHLYKKLLKHEEDEKDNNDCACVEKVDGTAEKRLSKKAYKHVIKKLGKQKKYTKYILKSVKKLQKELKNAKRKQSKPLKSLSNEITPKSPSGAGYVAVKDTEVVNAEETPKQDDEINESNTPDIRKLLKPQIKVQSAKALPFISNNAGCDGPCLCCKCCTHKNMNNVNTQDSFEKDKDEIGGNMNEKTTEDSKEKANRYVNEKTTGHINEKTSGDINEHATGNGQPSENNIARDSSTLNNENNVFVQEKEMTISSKELFKLENHKENNKENLFVHEKEVTISSNELFKHENQKDNVDVQTTLDHNEDIYCANALNSGTNGVQKIHDNMVPDPSNVMSVGLPKPSAAANILSTPDDKYNLDIPVQNTENSHLPNLKCVDTFLHDGSKTYSCPDENNKFPVEPSSVDTISPPSPADTDQPTASATKEGSHYQQNVGDDHVSQSQVKLLESSNSVNCMPNKDSHSNGGCNSPDYIPKQELHHTTCDIQPETTNEHSSTESKYNIQHIDSAVYEEKHSSDQRQDNGNKDKLKLNSQDINFPLGIASGDTSVTAFRKFKVAIGMSLKGKHYFLSLILWITPEI